MFRLQLIVCALLLASCALQPVTEPRRVDFANEPTLIPVRDSAEKPTYLVERGLVAEEIVLQGRVGSAVEVPIEATQTGAVSAVLVQNGAAVVAGDMLALLDTAELEAELVAVREALRSAENQLQSLRENRSTQQTIATLALERATLRLESADDDASESERRILEIDVELAQLALEQVVQTIDPELALEIERLQGREAELEAQIEVLRLVGSADGDLINFNLQTGGRVREGQTIGTLVNLDQLVVWADANEGTLAQLEEGLTVTLSLPDSDETFTGVIDVLPFPHGVGGGREGMIGVVTQTPLPTFASRVEVRITLAANDNALWLPPAALREFAGQPFVVVRDGESEQRIDVEVGIVSAGRVEISDGLREGQTIVAP